MGLSMSATNGWTKETKEWSYSYGTFARVRTLLAEKAGRSHIYAHGPLTPHGLLGLWLPEDTMEDDLDFLLVHYDTEGYLLPWTTVKLAKRIRKILSENNFEDFDRQVIVEMVELFEFAAGEESWEVITFS